MRAMNKKKVLVVGLGRFGGAIVGSLWNAHIETVVIDSSAATVDEMKSRADASFVGDATDPSVLRGVGAADVDVAIVTFGEDFEASVLCVAELKRLGVKEIVARAPTKSRADVLRAIGATRVVQIEEEMGRRVAADLVTPISAELLEFAHAHHVHPWTARGALVGKTLAQAELRRRHGITVLGYHRPSTSAPGSRRFEVATAEYKIVEGDVLLFVGETRAIQSFVTEQGE